MFGILEYEVFVSFNFYYLMKGSFIENENKRLEIQKNIEIFEDDFICESIMKIKKNNPNDHIIMLTIDYFKLLQNYFILFYFEFNFIIIIIIFKKQNKT